MMNDSAPGRVTGTKIFRDLIAKCVCDGGYKSEAALARAWGIHPQKINRWKLGKSRVSSEAVTLALILLSCPSPSQVKRVLNQRFVTMGRYIQH